MSLHASVAVPARDRRRLERLCRYVARPPLAHDRLGERPDGRLALRLKTPWRDGTTHILMERHELLERLVPLIPPPRAHQVRYHGVLAPCASARDRVVPGPRPPLAKAQAQAPLPDERQSLPHGRPGHPNQGPPTREDPAPLGGADFTSDPLARAEPARGDPGAVDPPHSGQNAAPARRAPRRTAWADLLQRVFEVDAL
ncbi:MAG: hypothetical protein GY788_24430, partial [bacterium]|nr:hypothetical protein [bacterium]